MYSARFWIVLSSNSVIRTVGGFGVDFYFNDAFSTVCESKEFMEDIVVHGRMLVVIKKLIHPEEFSPLLSFKSIFTLERTIFCPFFASSSARLHFETVDVQCVHLGCCAVCCSPWLLCGVCTSEKLLLFYFAQRAQCHMMPNKAI